MCRRGPDPSHMPHEKYCLQAMHSIRRHVKYPGGAYPGRRLSARFVFLWLQAPLSFLAKDLLTHLWTMRSAKVRNTIKLTDPILQYLATIRLRLIVSLARFFCA